MEKTDLAWFAAILEAEGSITAQVYTLPDGRVRLTPFVVVVNGDKGILDACFAIMQELTKGERASPRYCDHGPAGRTGIICRDIRVDGPSIKPILEAALPWMRSEKKRNAEVMLEYIQSRKDGLLIRGEDGRIVRAGYTRKQVELISSIRRHKFGKTFDQICEAPNVAA